MKKNTVGECYTTVRTSHVICDDKRNKAFDNAAIIVPDYYSCGESEYNKFLSIAYEEYTGSVLKHSWLSKMDKSIRVDSIKYNDNEEFLKEWPEFEEGFKHLGTITCERMYKNKKGQWVIPNSRINNALCR